MKAQNNEFKAKVKEAIDLIYLTTTDGPVKGKISSDRLTRQVVTELVSRGVLSKTGCNSRPVYEWAVKDQPTSTFYESVADSLSKKLNECSRRSKMKRAAAKEQQKKAVAGEQQEDIDEEVAHDYDIWRAVKDATDEYLCEELIRRGWRIANGRLEKTTVMLFEEDGIRKVTV